MNGKDYTTTFLPLDSRIGGQNRDSPTVGQYLTRDQTKYIHEKGRSWRNDKHRYDTIRNRTGKAARWDR